MSSSSHASLQFKLSESQHLTVVYFPSLASYRFVEVLTRARKVLNDGEWPSELNIVYGDMFSKRCQCVSGGAKRLVLNIRAVFSDDEAPAKLQCAPHVDPRGLPLPTTLGTDQLLLSASNSFKLALDQI
jgi:hypothetical protein